MSDWLGGLFQAVGDVVGGQLAAAQNRQAMRFSRDMQEDFARHGIAWRVQDAQEAGVHPLFALGAQIPSGQPMALGDVSGAGIAEAGQDIGRAIAAGRTPLQRQSDELDIKLKQAALEKAQGESASIWQDVFAKMNPPGSPPGIGVFNEGGGVTSGVLPNAPASQVPMLPGSYFDPLAGFFENKPAPVISHKQGDVSMQAGRTAGWQQVMIHPKVPLDMAAGEGQEATREMWNEMSLAEKALAIRRSAMKYSFDDPQQYYDDLLKAFGGGNPERDYTHGGFFGPPRPTIADKGRQWFKDTVVPKFERFKGEKRRYRRRFNKSAPEIPR